MWLVCRLPVATLVEQFKDQNLSAEECNALAPGSVFNRYLTRCLTECLRTGSQFFTNGWRMFVDEPGYALSHLASPVDVRLYVAGNDNVDLPVFAETIAAACTGTDVMEVSLAISQARAKNVNKTTGVFEPVFTQEHCRVWMLEGAGRMACMLYLQDALDNLLREE